MHKQLMCRNEIPTVGIQVRTNNALEMNSTTAIIPFTVQKYFHKDLASRIKHRKNLGITFCAYSDYESDHRGNYTYSIGEEVTHFSATLKDYHPLLLPAGNYIKLTSNQGPISQVLTELWQEIWQMSPKELGGKRLYNVDYEVYDERALDPNNASVDVYLGIQ